MTALPCNASTKLYGVRSLVKEDCSASTGAVSLTVSTGELTAQLPVGLCKETSICFARCILVRFKCKFYRELEAWSFQ